MAVKVTELAKELGKTNEEIMAAAKDLGIGVRTTNSTIEEDGVHAIRIKLGLAGKETKIVKAAPAATKAAPGATKAAPGATKAAPGATKAAPGAT
ncbi:MAG: translation initiation factor IF-2 N-terminal domain-containing protein, partial [Clostridiales bacterium]|nr:translation initiation factor IF-2 N-terminal domain-containing protein [Clostridiales bacterium]